MDLTPRFKEKDNKELPIDDGSPLTTPEFVITSQLDLATIVFRIESPEIVIRAPSDLARKEPLVAPIIHELKRFDDDLIEFEIEYSTDNDDM